MELPGKIQILIKPTMPRLRQETSVDALWVGKITREEQRDTMFVNRFGRHYCDCRRWEP